MTEEEKQAHDIIAEGDFYQRSNKLWGLGSSPRSLKTVGALI